MNREYYDILRSGVRAWNEWRQAHPDVRPDLRNAELSWIDLKWAELQGACLCDANLQNADLRCADLQSADLARADLWGVDLRGANLRDANIRGALIANCTGNAEHIKSIQTNRWSVAYTADVMQIGCERHPIKDWWLFRDEEISIMALRALDWWRRWKPILRQIIETSPAVPTR